MLPTVGSNVQYITGTIASPTYAAAVVTDVYGPDTVGLTVFPGPHASPEDFGPAGPTEVYAGVAQRPTVNRGESPGQWRPIPEATDTAEPAESSEAENAGENITPGEPAGG